MTRRRRRKRKEVVGRQATRRRDAEAETEEEEAEEEEVPAGEYRSSWTRSADSTRRNPGTTEGRNTVQALP